MPIPSTDKSSPVYRSPTIIPSTRVSSLTTLVNVATQRPVRDHVAHARIMAIGRNQIRHLEGNDTIRYDTSPRARRGSLRSTSSPGLHRETSRPGPVPSTCPSPPLSSSLSLSADASISYSRPLATNLVSNVSQTKTSRRVNRCNCSE